MYTTISPINSRVKEITREESLFLIFCPGKGDGFLILEAFINFKVKQRYTRPIN
jgi:hypothetical protein